MSDAKFDARPDELRNIASRISGLRSSAEGTAGNLDKQVETIKGGWEGEASQAYADKYKDLHKRLTNAVENIKEIETALNRAAETLENEEAQEAESFRSAD